MRKRDYQHGGDCYRNQVEYDFSVNINPLGMPEGMIKAAQKGVCLATAYPDERGEELCRAIAKTESVKEEEVLLGNGAAELIYALCYCIRPKKALVLAPTFQEYEAAILASGGEVVVWNLKEEDNFQLQKGIITIITEEIELLFLCNPNNPTGNIMSKELLVRVAQRCEETGTFFCLDECFLPFLEDYESLTMKGGLKQWKHLFILRAFTKLYAMPGLRLGYALSANEPLLQKMQRGIQPWNTSIPAQMAGIEALKETDYVERTRKLIKEEKEYLLRELSTLTEKIYESKGNYIFLKGPYDLQHILLQHKILIRSCANYRNLGEGYFRIAIRTREENKILIQKWKEGIAWQNQL